MMIFSPFSEGRGIDHTQYETVSILAFIEKIWGLPPLSNRDARADPFTGAFNAAQCGRRPSKQATGLPGVEPMPGLIR